MYAKHKKSLVAVAEAKVGWNGGADAREMRRHRTAVEVSLLLSRRNFNTVRCQPQVLAKIVL